MNEKASKSARGSSGSRSAMRRRVGGAWTIAERSRGASPDVRNATACRRWTRPWDRLARSRRRPAGWCVRGSRPLARLRRSAAGCQFNIHYHSASVRQAVVLYRLAIMSKDGDWMLREETEALTHVIATLARHGARYRYGAPLDLRWLVHGWSSHLELQEGGLRLRCDFVTRPPRVSPASLRTL